MVGNMFAGCDESPGQTIIIDGNKYKEYSGSSTHKSKNIEGVESLVRTKGSFESILTKMLDGLRSGMSYQGAHNLVELKDNPTFVRVTNAGVKESGHHDLDKIK